MLTGSVELLQGTVDGSADLATGSGPDLGTKLQDFLDGLTGLSGGTPK